MNKKQIHYWTQIAQFIIHINPTKCEILLQTVDSNAAILNVWSNDKPTYQEGAPLPFFSAKLIETKQQIPKDQLYVDTSLTPTKKASTLLIREEEKLIGLLSIIQDVSAYQEAAATILSFVNLQHLLEEKPTTLTSAADEPAKLISEIIQEVLLTLQLEGHRKYNKKQKLAIISELKKRGVFHTKGGVSEASKLLNIPEPSMYRYLSSLS